jgi:hypothetical protein
MIADQCTSFAGVEPITLPDVGNILDGSLKEVFDKLQLEASDLYYYADCQGGDNIPGVETNANSDSNSGSDDGIDAGEWEEALFIWFALYMIAYIYTCIARLNAINRMRVLISHHMHVCDCVVHPRICRDDGIVSNGCRGGWSPPRGGGFHIHASQGQWSLRGSGYERRFAAQGS